MWEFHDLIGKGVDEIGNVFEEAIKGTKEKPASTLALGPMGPLFQGIYRTTKRAIKRKEDRALAKAERGAQDAEITALTEATRQREMARQGALNEKRRRELLAGGSAFASALNLFTQRDPQQLTSLLGRVNDR